MQSQIIEIIKMQTSANRRDLVAVMIFLRNKSVKKMAQYPQKWLISSTDHAHKCNCKFKNLSFSQKLFYISVRKQSILADFRMLFGHQRADNELILVKN